jgi:hypothetical protein
MTIVVVIAAIDKLVDVELDKVDKGDKGDKGDKVDMGVLGVRSCRAQGKLSYNLQIP